MSFARGPVYIWWQNLADEEGRQRIHDDLNDALCTLAGANPNQRWREIAEARRTIDGLLRGKLGPMWRHGRAWVRLYRSAADRKTDRSEPLLRLGVSWSLLRRQHSLGGSVYLDSGEGEVTASLRVPRAGIYITLELPRALRQRIGYRDERELGVTFHDGALWFKLWNDPHDWHSSTPFSDARSSKRQPVLHLDDLLFGKVSYRTIDLETQEGTLQLDGGYEVKARRFMSEWKRPRWPVPQRIMRVEIEIPGGIPIPGKGENSYDCEDDAIYGRTSPAASIDEAAHTLIADVLETRRKRGGVNWKPAKAAA
jgi:hypothetical protein